MGKQSFIKWNPSKDTLKTIELVNGIIDNYLSMGYNLTLRQLYYQLVSEDLIPNKQSEYKKLGTIVAKGRMSGRIDWSAIEDRVRSVVKRQHWEKPGDIIKAAANSFHTDHWRDQETYLEVWCEKDAVSNIIEPVCDEYDVPFMANRGYSSVTAMYEAANRLFSKFERRLTAKESELFDNGELDVDFHKNIIILYFGDHDPSGLDMIRDIEDRIRLFLLNGCDEDGDMTDARKNHMDYHSKEFEVIPVALNKSQIRQYNLPKNPAKSDDSRYKEYVNKHGDSSWELDALKPQVLSELVKSEILEYLDVDKFNAIEAENKTERAKLIKLAEKYNEGGLSE